MTAEHAPGVEVWPAERFYWSLLDVRDLPRIRRKDTQRLGFLFEPWIPVAIEEVQATYLPVSQDSVLACGVERATLEGLPAEIVELRPDALPEFVGAEVPLAKINLLTGPHEPPTVRRAKHQLLCAVLAFAAVILSIATLGNHERAALAAAKVEELRGRTEAIRDGLGLPTGGQLPLALQLEAEVRELERTRPESGVAEQDPDATEALAALLSHWPEDVDVQTTSVLVAPESIHVNATLRTSGAAQALALDLAETPGWELQQPRIRTVRDRSETTIELRRDP